MYQTHLTDKGLGSVSFLSAPQVTLKMNNLVFIYYMIVTI